MDEQINMDLGDWKEKALSYLEMTKRKLIGTNGEIFIFSSRLRKDTLWLGRREGGYEVEYYKDHALTIEQAEFLFLHHGVPEWMGCVTKAVAQ